MEFFAGDHNGRWKIDFFRAGAFLKRELKTNDHFGEERPFWTIRTTDYADDADFLSKKKF